MEIFALFFITSSSKAVFCFLFLLKKALTLSCFILNKKAKKSNRPFFVYNNEIDTKDIIEKSMHWREKIKKAIEDDTVVPFYQAIFDKNKNIIKYETLMRIKDTDENGTSTYHWFWIGSHEDYNNILKNLKNMQNKISSFKQSAPTPSSKSLKMN